MKHLFRETAVGQIIRLITARKFLQYADETDPEGHRVVATADLSCTSTMSRWTTTRNPAFHNLESTRSNTRSIHSQINSSNEEKPLESGLVSPHSSNQSDQDTLTQLDVSQMKTLPDARVITFLPDDPDNPQNWSFFKKCFVTCLVCFLTFSIYIGSAIYTSGSEGVQEKFGVSEVVAVLGLTMFVFGYGLGPMILAPFAEAPPIGRTPVYVLSSFCFVFLNFGVVYASNLGMLLAFRFLTGFFGSPVLATGGSSMADLWSEKKRGYAIGVWGAFAVLGPSLGPLVGGFAVQAKGWTWAIWELIWLNGVCFVILAFLLPETSPDTILLRRAQRLRKAFNDDTLQSASEIEVQNMKVKELVLGALWRPFQLMVEEPILLLTDLYLGLIYAVLYCWFEAFPIAFISIHHFSLGSLGLSYLGILVGAIVILIPYFIYLYLVQEKKFENNTMTPEDRLPPALVGSFLIPICLFWFGWTARPSVHWIVPIIGSSLFSMGATLLFNSILNYQGDAFPKYVGSALAGNDFARSAMGGAFPIFATAMFHRLGLGWGCSLLGFLSICFIPMIFVFYIYGPNIRAASRNASSLK